MKPKPAPTRLKRAPVYDLISTRKKIPDNFKCCGCAWGTFLGDRFFCPLVHGTCVKAPLKAQKGGKT